MAPCERIPYPTKEEATFAACIIFSYLSEKEIPHAFIGRFAEAMTSTVPVEMDVLEILVEHGLGEIETLFNDLVSGRNTRYSGFLASTDDSERCPIALVYRLGHRHHHMGVALSFVRAGSNMFPYKLDHGNNDSTCVKITVHDMERNERNLPVLRPRHLLAQKLRIFRTVHGNKEKSQAVRDIKRILVAAAAFPEGFAEGPFSPAEAFELLRIIEPMLEFGHSRAIDTTSVELERWRKLGVNLNNSHLPVEIGNNQGILGIILDRLAAEF